MLDYRLQTFLALCRHKSYTRTAKELHLTQPAVTRHIQQLEQTYGVPLVIRGAREVRLTPEGEALRRFAAAVDADARRMEDKLAASRREAKRLHFGATLTIGEFVLPDILCRYRDQYPGCEIRLEVENTAELLRRLDAGVIDFALIEGYFDKGVYGHAPLSAERFFPVCGAGVPLPEGPATLESLCSRPLIVREPGSGTREVLENLLHEQNLSAADFASLSEIGNFRALKELVARGDGITFAYAPAVAEEIRTGILREIPLDGPGVTREFCFVWLKDSLFDGDREEFRRFCLENRPNHD